MAEMRLPARCSVLLAGLLLLTLPALAAAEPKPIAKPTDIAPIKPTKSSTPPRMRPCSRRTPPAAPPAPPPAPPSPPASTRDGDRPGSNAPVDPDEGAPPRS